MTCMRSELGIQTPGFDHSSPEPEKHGDHRFGHHTVRQGYKAFLYYLVWYALSPGVDSVSIEMFQGLTLCQPLGSGFFIRHLILTSQCLYKFVIIITIPILQRKKLRLRDIKILVQNHHEVVEPRFSPKKPESKASTLIPFVISVMLANLVCFYLKSTP